MPVIRSNELSYEATDVGGWSFVGSNVPFPSFKDNSLVQNMLTISVQRWAKAMLKVCLYCEKQGCQKVLD